MSISPFLFTLCPKEGEYHDEFKSVWGEIMSMLKFKVTSYSFDEFIRQYKFFLLPFTPNLKLKPYLKDRTIYVYKPTEDVERDELFFLKFLNEIKKHHKCFYLPYVLSSQGVSQFPSYYDGEVIHRPNGDYNMFELKESVKHFTGEISWPSLFRPVGEGWIIHEAVLPLYRKLMKDEELTEAEWLKLLDYYLLSFEYLEDYYYDAIALYSLKHYGEAVDITD